MSPSPLTCSVSCATHSDFSVGHFASMYAEKLGLREAVLHKTLWGDFYLNTKTKRIMKGAQVSVKL